jgi:hypothetical protein
VGETCRRIGVGACWRRWGKAPSEPGLSCWRVGILELIPVPEGAVRYGEDRLPTEPRAHSHHSCPFRANISFLITRSKPCYVFSASHPIPRRWLKDSAQGFNPGTQK